MEELVSVVQATQTKGSSTKVGKDGEGDKTVMAEFILPECRALQY